MELGDRQIETEAITEETKIDSFLKLMKDINPQIQEALQTQVRFPTKKRTLCSIKVQLLKTKDRKS